MKIIMTLSGNSDRFVSKGYTIKPLIKIDDKTIFEYALDMFKSNIISESDFIFLVRNDDISTFGIEQMILSNKKGKIFGIKKNNLGPVYSISNIFKDIPDNEEIVVSYCDFTQNWNFEEFISFCRKNNVDGCVVTHKGFHPHKLYNKSFAFLKTNGDDVLQIQEKKPFTESDINEPASNGIYYFKSGNLLKKYFQKLIDLKICVNGEYYVTLPYNLMIEDKLKVLHYNTDDFICLGTPEDVICFESWINILKYNKIQKENINQVFDYWKNYLST